MSEDEKVEELRQALTGKSKKPYITVSTEALFNMVSACSVMKGILISLALILKSNGNTGVEYLLKEVDRAEGDFEKALNCVFR